MNGKLKGEIVKGVKSISDEWNECCKLAGFDENTDRDKVRALKRAFYWGAMGLMGEMNIAAAKGAGAKELWAIMEKYNNELDNFLNLVKQDKD